MTIKVDVRGLEAAAQKLFGLAEHAQGVAADMAPLGADPTSGGAAARLSAAARELWGAACAQAQNLHAAGEHLLMIAAKFASTEERNANVLLQMGYQLLQGLDDTAIAALAPVPPLPPDVRPPLPPGTPLSGEGFAQLVHSGSSANGVGFSNTASNNGIAADNAAAEVRGVAATVPELWDSPDGTAALTGRLNEYVSNLTAIADRWFALADQSRRHADDYSQTVAVTPKPEEFRAAHDEIERAQGIGRSQAIARLGRLEAQATAEASRYAGVTEATTGVGTPQAPAAPAGAGAGGGAAAGAGGAAAAQSAAARAGQSPQLAKSAAAEAGQAGQAGEGVGQLAQMLPAALGAIGGLAGGVAGMVGQVPQGLMQAGQGLAQAATQGMSGLASKTPTDADLAKKIGADPLGDLPKAEGRGGGGAGGAGATHPAGALGPPVTPSTSHTAPAVPSGAAPSAGSATPAGGSAMGGTPMGMPMGGMMPHGQGGGDAGEKAEKKADKKIVTPPQPHTEAVTGRVSDRTAAAAEAARNRAESDSGDPPPRGPVLRRITLAPLNDERS